MSFRLSALAFAGAIAASTSMTPTPGFAASGVSCVVPNLWKAEATANFARLSYQQSLFDNPELSEGVAREVYLAQIRQREIAGLREQAQLLRNAAYVEGPVPYQRTTSSRSWKAAYKGTGYDRMTGEARERVARGGVLWLVKPADLGVSSATAVTALMDAGATVARAAPGGMVEFRAPREQAQQIAASAASSLGGGSVTSAPAYGGLRAETAVLRLEGRVAQSATQFIEGLPTSGMAVYPYGTSFAVHVRSTDLDQLRYYLEDQGNSILLVGASAPLVEGAGVGIGIRSCGANVLADRFPTPMVQAKGAGSANVRIDNQVVAVAKGDILMIVQPPAYGAGLEVALVRFIG